MGSFKFRLETLLRLRRSARDECRAKVGEAIQAEQELRRQMSQKAFELSNAREHVRSAGKAGQVNVDSLLATHRYELVLRTQHQQLATQVTQVEQEIERRRLVLVEADKQVRILEKMSEKQRADFETEALQQENREMDEIAGQRYGRAAARRFEDE